MALMYHRSDGWDTDGGRRLTHTADPAHAEVRQAPLGALCEQMLRLGEASLNINESIEFDSVLQVVVDSARELTGARFGGLTVIDESGLREGLVTSGMTAEQHRLLTEMPGGVEFFEHLGRLNEPLGVADLAAYFASQGLPEFRPASSSARVWWRRSAAAARRSAAST